MRVCELHRERAVETLVSTKDKTEYDLCEKCMEMMGEILSGKTEAAKVDGRTRAARTAKNA